jgi:phage terminase large subunit
MWSTLKDTGKTMAELYTQNGIGLVKASNQRVQGWMVLKEYLKMRPDGKPGLLITENCARLIRDLPALQHDEKNPSDVAKIPHDITHAPDAVRYGLVFRTMGAQYEVTKVEDDDDYTEDYEEYMTGGEVTDSYMSFGG